MKIRDFIQKFYRFLVVCSMLLYPVCAATIFSDDFSTDKGWTGYGAGGWTRGSAVGSAYDPGIDVSPSGDNSIIGNYIGSNYPDYMAQTYWLQSPPFSGTNLTAVQLQFYRWLSVESAAYDHAYIQISNAGGWQTIWQNAAATIQDTSWTLQSIDISAYATNCSNCVIRFGLGSSDSSITFGGWSIDDVLISGTLASEPSITISAPSNAGASNSIVIAWIDSDSDNDASISLFYDTDNTGTNGTFIASGISEDSAVNQYVWDVSSISNGSYYVYAVITDGAHTNYNYCSGLVHIYHPVGLILWNTLESTAAVSNSVIGSNGICVSGLEFTNGRHSNAIRFNGLSKYVTFPLWPSNTHRWGVDEITIEMWAKPAASQINRFLFDFVRGRQANDGFLRIAHYTDSQLQYSYLFGALGYGYISYTWDTTAFHHFAYSISASAAKLFIDGIEVVSQPISALVSNTYMPYELVLGTEFQYNSTFQWNGIIDNVKVYDHAKTNFSDRLWAGTNMNTPVLFFTGPITNTTTASNIVLRWEDGDADSDAQIWLYRTTNAGQTNGTLIAGPLSEDSSSNQYSWDMSALPTGTYYVYAVISDGAASNASFAAGNIAYTALTSPSITLFTPSNSVVCDTNTSYLITWADSDSDSDASIFLYYTTNGYTTNGGVLIAGPLSENSSTNQYLWDLSLLTNCVTYYLYALITDGTETNTAIASGTVYKPLRYALPFYDNFNSDKGWQGYGPGGWQRGAAIGSGGDPATDTSADSTNYIIGNYLGAAYPDNMTQTYWLTSPLVYATNHSSVFLSFNRWLGVESSTYDHAYVQISNAGGGVIVWSNTSTIQDISWTHQEFDITACATNTAGFFVRFGLGGSDSSVNLCGWNIDDITVTGTHENIPSISVTGPSNYYTASNATITWIDSDANDNASISLYYDTDTNGTNGTLITSGISEDSPSNMYVWNLSALPEGTYYVYAVISDSTTTNFDYGPGAVIKSLPVNLPVSDAFATTSLTNALWDLSAVMSSNYTINTLGIGEPSAPNSLVLDGGVGRVTTRTIDTTPYSRVRVTFAVERGGILEVPDPGEYLRAYYYNGSAWILAWALEGNSVPEIAYAPFSIDITGAATSLFRLRFETSGSGPGVDYFLIDEISISGYIPSTPYIALTAPSNERTSNSFSITWTDADSDNNASISLYYDNDGYGTNGTLIASGISEDSAVNSYTWNCSGISNGKYYIYAVITDGTTTTYAYSPGYVSVYHPAGLAFWNTLNSPAAVSNSEIGTGAVAGSGSDYCAGIFSNAIRFDNSYEYLLASPWPEGSRVWGVDEMTVEFWAKNTGSQDDNMIMQFARGMGNSYGYLYLDQYNNVQANYGNVFGVANGGSFSNACDSNSFHHFAFSVTRSNATVYRDGIAAVSQPISPWSSNTVMPYQIIFGIDWLYNTYYQWTGAIDNIRIYDYAKTNFDDRFWEGTNVNSPFITFTMPSTNVVTMDTNIPIAWVDGDMNDDAAIRLYYTTNAGQTNGGVLIAGPLSENAASNSYVWDVSAMTSGRYFIYGIITDGTETNSSFAPGYIDLSSPNDPHIEFTCLTSNVSVITDTTMNVTWVDRDSNDNAVIALYYDTDSNGYNGVLITNGIMEDDASNHYVWNITALSNGTYYLYAVINDASITNRVYTAGALIKQAPLLLPFKDDFSSDRGWSGYGSGGWTRGPAAAGGGDPAADTTPSADNFIAGNYIGNVYPNNMPQTYWLESPAFIGSNCIAAVLSFSRWLGVENAVWDHACVQVFNGSIWTNVWQNPSNNIIDTSWVDCSLDISEHVTNASFFRVRFGLGTSDSVYSYSGWNIDDVRIVGYGINSPRITLLTPSNIIASNSAIISWSDSDPDNDASISLYYSTSPTGTNGTLIAGGISEDDVSNQYVWNTTGLSNGYYYVYAVISDSTETNYDYAPTSLYVYHPSGLVLWNKLGSTAEVTGSSVGLNGYFTNTPGTFTNGKFGSAYRVGPGQSGGIEFPKEVIPPNEGCIEFWAKLEGYPANIPSGPSPQFFTAFDGASYYTITFTHDLGPGIGGLAFAAGSIYAGGTGVTTTRSYESILGLGATNSWHHYALVWSKNTIPGTGVKAAVYLNGVLHALCTNYFDNNFPLLTSGSLILVTNNGIGVTLIDNIKIWDCPKTNFTDRFTENSSGYILIEDEHSNAYAHGRMFTADSNITLNAAYYNPAGMRVGYTNAFWMQTGGFGSFSATNGATVSFDFTTPGAGDIIAWAGMCTNLVTNITVAHGNMTSLRIEHVSGTAWADNLMLTTDSNCMLYSAGYDADGNRFLTNAFWTQSVLIGVYSTNYGGTVALDCTRVTNGDIAAMVSGWTDAVTNISILPGALASLTIEDAFSNRYTNGSTFTADSNAVFYAACYDADSNRLGYTNVYWTQSASFGIFSATNGYATVLDFSNAASGIIAASAGGLSNQISITVLPGAYNAVRIALASNSGAITGSNMYLYNMDVTSLYLVRCDSDGNIIGPDAGFWHFSGNAGHFTTAAAGTNRVTFAATNRSTGMLTVTNATGASNGLWVTSMDNPPAIAGAGVSMQPLESRVVVGYSLSDRDGDAPMTVALLYRESGGTTWHPFVPAAIDGSTSFPTAGTFTNRIKPVGCDVKKRYDIKVVVSANGASNNFIYPDVDISTLFLPANDINGAVTINNPYRGTGEGVYFVNLTENAAIEVYTVAGAFVARVKTDTAEGIGRALWNVRNADGKPVSPGVYYCVVRDGMDKKMIRVIVSKTR